MRQVVLWVLAAIAPMRAAWAAEMVPSEQTKLFERAAIR